MFDSVLKGDIKICHKRGDKKEQGLKKPVIMAEVEMSDGYQLYLGTTNFSLA